MFGLLYQQEIQSKTWYFSLCCVNILNILHMLRGFGFHWFCWSFNKRVFIEQLTPATYQTSIWALVVMMLAIQKKKKLSLFEWSKTLLASFGDINICLLWKKKLPEKHFLYHCRKHSSTLESAQKFFIKIALRAFLVLEHCQPKTRYKSANFVSIFFNFNKILFMCWISLIICLCINTWAFFLT